MGDLLVFQVQVSEYSVESSFQLVPVELDGVKLAGSLRDIEVLQTELLENLHDVVRLVRPMEVHHDKNSLMPILRLNFPGEVAQEW